MTVKEMIENLTSELMELVSDISGAASIQQQNLAATIIESIGFYSTRLMLFGDDEIEGT